MVTRKKDTFTESSLAQLAMKNISQQLETSKSELTKFRSNTNEERSLSRNKESNVDTSFTPFNLENNVKNKNTKDKVKLLQRQLFQKDNCKKHGTNTTIYRENLDFCITCDAPGDLMCSDICPSSFHLTCIGVKKKDDVETSKDNINNHPDVISCQVYDKEGETISFNDPNNVNQVEKKRLNEINRKSEKVQDIKTDLVEYINERSKEKQQILSNIIRKNQKVLDVLVHRKKRHFHELKFSYIRNE